MKSMRVIPIVKIPKLNPSIDNAKLPCVINESDMTLKNVPKIIIGIMIIRSVVSYFVD